MITRASISFLVFATCAFPTKAHDIWADGSSVPAWIKSACCGPRDVHHLNPDQVHRVDNGYIVDGYPRIVPAYDLLPSQDGEWWIFYEQFGKGVYSDVYCFFGPVGV